MSSDPLADSLSGGDLPAEGLSLVLLARAQAGDQEALRELLERYQDRLRRIVRIQLNGSPLRRLHDSMDVVQNTFIAALPKLGELQPRSAASLLRWLALIATNQLRDVYGRETAEKRDLRRQSPLESGELVQRADPATALQPERKLEEAELRERLDAEVAELPHDQRQVVLLHDYCGEGWDHIARELGRESGAARQLHQRAWIRLRSRMRPWLEDRRSGGAS